MSHPNDGIIRTASGGQTYAPDGHIDREPQPHEEVEEPLSSESSSEPKEYMPIAANGHNTRHLSSGSSTDVEKYDNFDEGESSENSERGYEPINAGDQDELRRIASSLSRRPISRRNTGVSGGDLEKVDTLAGLDESSPALDPNSKEFDIYKWLRMFMRSLDEEDIKIKRAGVLFRDLNVSGSGSALNLQKNVGSLLLAPLRPGDFFSFHKNEKKILHDFNGLMKSGELLIVLGRPGSGCSTLLKSMCGELHGLDLDEKSTIHYNGIPQKKMLKEFKGEVVYNQEVDKHFPHLTVGETLEFAASVRTPSNRIKGIGRKQFAQHVTKVVMATFGLSHTYNTKVGNDFVRGVSGGERKRVSIAEMALSAAPLAAWDNSTRGLDAATALQFVKSLRLSSDLGGSAHAVAIYQASQAIYDVFDKAVVLYEGRQIYFGPTSRAKAYFEEMGWYCPPRQTTGDFLTSVTNPSERKPREGMERQIPRTPEDFEKYWRNSADFKALQQELDDHEAEFPVGGEIVSQFQENKRAQQAQHTRPKSPYMISIPMQVSLCTKRAYQRIWNDKSSTATTVVGQIIMALIIGSLFYGTPNATQGFYSKDATLFFAILLNALIAISEINALYAQRPIVEKHASYAFYHPFTEAVAGIVSDVPVKFLLAVCFNIILYFLANLHRSAGQFFLYFLVVFISMFVMSAIFRTMAALTKTVSQAMALAGVLVLAIVVYTGFVLPVSYMHSWFKWIHYLNPIYYAFEILMANEFHGHEYTCSEFIPAYTPMIGESWVCSVTGARAGEYRITGDQYIAAAYDYYWSHVWRNFGILCAFLIGFMAIYFLATELNSSTSSQAEVLVFRRGFVPDYMKEGAKGKANDEEMMAPEAAAKEGAQNDDVNMIPAQKDVFTWRDVTYDIQIKGEPRRLLDHVSGWVKPGTLTALMGVSGAGKTTLLDVLAQRTSMGVITGDMLVNGKPLDSSFQRKTGYVQQQDLHLETATVRESLRFSAELRQPKSVSKKEKYDYVEDVIKMLNMEDFAEAVVGVPGQGLNVEQRKLLTIGVELAAKPKLLLFLDEPTSGLDSQSSWAICAFLRKLADAGQAVLCTIHQPSAILFQEFDRLLFLAKGGRTVYFGNIGKNSRTLLDYFESHGARKCDDEENPAEYMLEIVGAGPGVKNVQDWHEVWKSADESKAVQEELDRIHSEKQNEPQDGQDEARSHSEFAMPFWSQLYIVSYRVFQQYWRMPEYVFAKFALGIASGLFIGFSFWNSDTSRQGIQNVIFSVFMVSTIFSTMTQQIMPLFITQRSLYEVRERPSKAYSWKAFLIANITVEIPYQIVTGILVYACYYYAVNGIQSSERQGLVLLFVIQFFIFASSFSHMLIAALPDSETAGAIATLLFSMMLAFNGVMQPPDALPGFWIFMYRVSPFTYWVAGIAATELHAKPVNCSENEVSIFNPPPGQTCGQYISAYLTQAPGQLQNPLATADCRYCSLSTADQYLAGTNIYWSERWRNFGIVWAYIVFNIFMATVLYYMFRVRKWDSTKMKARIGKLGYFSKAAFNKPSHPAKNERGEEQQQQNNRVI
ncbi:ATP-binding cassette transporter ABC1 [Saccharata proteae CBS 121410]|uniref:ATP-binding cassette transporter ABC1 n=1 Tax=Saccharata proteae CBS 121410 TaxID=1314787 RepID=A0A9P4HUP1_9PEZI|nr:ATP-binding cassette transporter ABC1 [Saccharata proteae CBS 121410]